MRLHLIRTIFLVSTFLLGKAQAQFGMPGFREVVTHFFVHYGHDDPESYLQFYCNKEGWFVAKDRYANPGQRFDPKLIWSKKTGQYLSTRQPVNEDSATAAEKISQYMIQIDGEYEEHAFSRNLYYGYKGWDWDVIQEAGTLTGKSDILLESIGRAYFYYASGFLGTQLGEVFENADKDRAILSPITPITKARLDKFIQYELKAIEAYAQLKVQNPAYETRVGNIEIKWANEYLSLAMELWGAVDPDRAVQYARQAKYPDSLLTLSRQYLDATPLNGWLVTHGDNDTYPLLYLQWTQKHRPDVRVINYHLLGYSRYAYQFDKQENFKLFSTKPEDYTGSSLDYVRYSNDSGTQQEISAQEWLMALQAKYNPHQVVSELQAGQPVRSYYSQKVYLRKNTDGEKKQLSIGRHLLRQDYLLLDMILTNPSRIICATYPPDFLQEAFTPEGIIYRL